MRTQQRSPRLVFLWLWLGVVALFTLQCGPAGEAPRPAEVAPATIRWATWEISSRAEALLIEQFREQYPQIEFKRQGLDSPWQTLWQETPLPDLVNMDAGYELDAMIRQNQVADVTELWSQTGLVEQVPASLQKLTERDGKQFYIPFGFGWVGMY